jgi:hypothetical protein
MLAKGLFLLLAPIALVRGGNPTGSTSSAADTVTKSRAAGANVVTIVAKDFMFGAPKSIPAGLTTIELSNAGPNLHHVQLMKFTGKHTVKDYVEALKKAGPTGHGPEWATPMGGPNAVVPGDKSRITEVLEPGRYGVVCFVDTPDHVPHLFKGMSADLIVRGSAKGAKLPSSDNTLRLVDYQFVWEKPLHAGHQRVTVMNDAAQGHEVLFVQLAPGKTGTDMLNWLDKMAGPPPGKPMGGVSGILKGNPVSVPLDLVPGNYFLICFAPDAKDGKPHFMHGMVQTVAVK